MRLEWRVLVGTGLLLCSGFAAASFDLLLAVDTANRRVHRYDGTTGTYLGFFAQGWVGPNTSLALNQPANEVAVTTDRNIRVFDYNTGELKRMYQTTHAWSTISAEEPGVFYGSNSLAISRFDFVNGTSSTVFTPISTSGMRHIVGNAGIFEFTDGPNQRLYKSNNNGATWTFSTIPGSVATPLLATAGQAIESNNAFSDTYYVTPGSNTLFFEFGTGFGTIPIPGYTSLTGLGRGHAGSTFFMGQSGTSTFFSQMDRFQTLGPTFSMPQVGTPGRLAVVVAPEPGTLLALGAGVALLGRRRLRRA